MRTIILNISQKTMKIALIGYGKMGKEIEKAALSRGQHEIVCIIDVDNQEDFESEAFKSADVAIEFNQSDGSLQQLYESFQSRSQISIRQYRMDWRNMAKKSKSYVPKEEKPFSGRPYFSLGVAIFSSVNKYLAKIMNQFPSYDVTMSETHHIHKLDAPQRHCHHTG